MPAMPQEMVAASTEMSNYIDIDKYNLYEEGHPGYHEMMAGVVNSTISSCIAALGTLSEKNKAKIAEIGSGTGNYTRRIGAEPFTDVTAYEIDSVCNGYLTHKIAAGEIQNTQLMQGNFLTADDSKTYHAINSTFTDHHFCPQDKPELLNSIHKKLQENGEYILGDEFLPPHDETNPAARVCALVDYHGMVMEEAFKEGKIELPLLEYDALISGLRTTVRFIQQTMPDGTHEYLCNFTNGQNAHNQKAVEHLRQTIQRLKTLESSSLANPEQLPETALVQKRTDFICELEKLADEMTQSRQPGLETQDQNALTAGDYKMTVRQYTQFLEDAGFKATGYFEGPKPVGLIADPQDDGTCVKPIVLKPDENHTGGVWVIRATTASPDTLTALR